RAPHVLTLSPEARAAWVAFYDGRAAEDADAEGVLAAALAQTEVYAARLALLHHVISRVHRGVSDLEPIGRESLEAGVGLARWFSAEMRRIYAKMFDSADERNADKLVGVIQARGGRITLRELMQTNSRRYPDAASATAALARLVEIGLGRWA